MRGPSWPVSAYSGNRAWGQGRSWADTENVTAPPGSHPQQRLCVSHTAAASPLHGVGFSPAGLSGSLQSQPFSGGCSGSHGFPELLSLSEVTALLWKRSSRGAPQQDRSSLSFSGIPLVAFQILH